MTDSNTPEHVPNRKPFFMVLGLFFAPLLLAFAVYYGSSWRPTGTTNKGELITPAIPLPEVALTKADGSATDATFLRGNWTLVYVDAGDCTQDCRTALATAQNAHQLLGKDATRVARVFLYTGACCDAALSTEQPDLLSASVDSANGKAILDLFPLFNGLKVTDSKHVYIVDPLGNLMMSYAPGSNPRSIYQDLKKLLDLSHIG
ncbi:MAG: hypothetical protein QM808_08060 [Steroidobacteraceae bacterium]